MVCLPYLDQLSEISKENEKHKHSLFEVTEESKRRERILQIPVHEIEMTEIKLGSSSFAGTVMRNQV